jgi:rubrerythrin
VASRRTFLGGATLSAAAIYLLDGNGTAAAMAAAAPSNDVAILNVALGLEHEAIAAYQLGAESHLLTPPVLQVALLFQGHHKGHRDLLIGAIQQLGGTPVASKTNAQYAEALHASTLHSQADVLGFAKGLELGAINAYLGVIPSFDNKDFGKVCGRLAADETMHWTVLTQALGQALPTAPLTFGA